MCQRTMLSTTSVRDMCCLWSLHEPACANALCCPQPRCETCVVFGASISLHVPTRYVVHNLGARRVLFWSLPEPTCANALCCPQPRCETCVVFGAYMSLHVPMQYVVHNGARRALFLSLHECCPQPRCETCVFRSLHEPTCANALCCPQPRCETCVVFGAYMSLHVPTHYVVQNLGARWCCFAYGVFSDPRRICVFIRFSGLLVLLGECGGGGGGSRTDHIYPSPIPYPPP